MVKEWEKAKEVLLEVIEQRIILTKTATIISPSKLTACKKLLKADMKITMKELNDVQVVLKGLNEFK